MTTRAVVLGGGGVAGIAWEAGVMAALAAGGVDLNAADVVVGTSAGSVTGALLRSGADLEALLADQTAVDSGGELAVEFSLERMVNALAQALPGATGEQDARARVGALALVTETVPEETRRDVIRWRLGFEDWPAGRLLVTAIDTRTGEFLTFDADSGVGLIDAIAASCAVPTVWPPVTIDARRLMDGGLRSVTNADLAAGHDRVLVLVPFRGFPWNPMGPTLDAELQILRERGEVVLVEADQAALEAFGTNPLSPETRGPSAEAGRRQGEAVLEAVRALWDA